MKLDPRFAAFEDFADELFAQFWAQHYPGGDLDDVGQDYSELREALGNMIPIIEAATGVGGGQSL